MQCELARGHDHATNSMIGDEDWHGVAVQICPPALVPKVREHEKKSDWYFPPDLAALLGLYCVVLPIALLGGWLGTGIYNARSVGDTSPFTASMVLLVVLIVTVR